MIGKRNAFLYGLFLLPAGLQAQQLYVGSNTSIVMGVSSNMVLNNTGFICNGNLSTDTGTVLFTGNASADIAVIGGTTTTSFFNLVINKSSGNVGLVGQANVKGRLIMNNGNLLLNNHTLDLGTTGSLAGEKEQSRVTGNGYIMASRVLNVPKFVNVGNLGLSITSSSFLGTTNVLRSNIPQMLPGGTQSIARSYTVFHFLDGEGRVSTDLSSNIAGPVVPTYNISFHYLNAELNGLAKSALTIWNGGPAVWTFVGKSSEDTANNVLNKNGLTAMSGTYNIGLPSGSGARTSKEEPTVVPAPGSVQLFPNPAHDHCTLVVYGKGESNDVLSLYNSSGNLLQQKQLSLHEGANKIEWDLHAYSAGTYYIRSQNNAFKSVVINRL